MNTSPWDNPDLDDYEYKQQEFDGTPYWLEDGYMPSKSDVGLVDLCYPTPPYSPGHALPELAAPINEEKRFRLPLWIDSRRYVRTEVGWFDVHGAIASAALAMRLERTLVKRLTDEDDLTSDPAFLLTRAWFAQALGHTRRVEELSRAALRAHVAFADLGSETPPDARRIALAAASLLSSSLRQQRRADKALAETAIFATEEYAPLMTSRAAALCDMGQWEAGHELAIRARDLRGSDVVIKLLDRIQRHRVAIEDRAHVQ
jgi:hypothetical protein